MKNKSLGFIYFILLFIIAALEILITVFNGKFITLLKKRSSFDIIVKFMVLFFVSIIFKLIFDYFYNILVAKYIENEKFNKKFNKTLRLLKI